MSQTVFDSLPFNPGALDGRFVPMGPDEPVADDWILYILFRGDSLIQGAGCGTIFFEGCLPDWAGSHDRGILMGTWEGHPVRIVEVGADVPIPADFLAEPLLFTFFQERLPSDLVTVAGRAQQIIEWERRSKVCSCCGAMNERIPGTWGKRCIGCGYEHFPNIAPCTLVLVARGEELLLIRKPEWPKGYYSLPSGFCEFGESLEECARREVEEETGIRVTDLRYVASQNWPFPGQIMIGFLAGYGGGEIDIDREELEGAAWFRRDSLPPILTAGSIAGCMIERFRDGMI